MTFIRIFTVFAAVLVCATAVAQEFEELSPSPPVPPIQEEGAVVAEPHDLKSDAAVAVRATLQTKIEVCERIIACKAASSAAKGRASNELARLKSQLSAVEKRLKTLEERVDVHSALVWKHESQLNNPENGLAKRVAELEETSARKADLSAVMRDISNSADGIVGRVTSLEIVTGWIVFLGLAVVALCAIGFFLRRVAWR